MTFSPRPYQTTADLHKIQTTTAEWITLAGFRGYMNVSDIGLRLFNGMRQYNPAEIVRLWEDAGGRLVGWSMIYPAWNSYEALLHPDYRQHPLEHEILAWAERELTGWLHKTAQGDSAILLNVFDEDTGRIALLEARGYSRRDQSETISTRSLDAPIPPPQLPDGFSIRAVQGEHEADKVVAHINDSFGWRWTVDNYRQFMRSPGYSPGCEWVVVAPDGRFAASCILLPDAHNRTVMIENVGTGREFRRLGLAKALLYAAISHMKAQGFMLAMIPHGVGLSAATALYTSAGFHPTYAIFHYSKTALSLASSAL